MRILIAAAELAPHATAGSVGPAVAALAVALADAGRDVCVAIPAHGGPAHYPGLDLDPVASAVDLPLGSARVRVEFLHGTDPRGFEVILVHSPGLLDRGSIYGGEEEEANNAAARYLLFSKAVVELARLLRPGPDLLHLHDWPAASAAAFARAGRLAVPTVLSLHGTEWHGSFASHAFALTNLGPDWFTPETFEFHGRMNLLKGGILAADRVTLPGAIALQHALLPGGASGLDGALRSRHQAVCALQHGPLPPMPARLPARKPGMARNNRLEALGLAPDPEGPVFVLPGADAMAMELAGPMLDRLLADDVRLILAGRPPESHRAAVEIALRRHPGRIVAARPGPDDVEPFLAADFGLAVGHPAPDGGPLPALLAAGLPPIARVLPGIHALARDFDPTDQRGWAFLFYRDTPEALYDAIRRAKRAWGDPGLRATLAARAHKHAPTWRSTADGLMALRRGW
jgi:starch synthase